jgi:hypothetical protein
MDEYKLPSVYGKSRLVLLAVHPYLIHAYWEIAPDDFDKAKEQAEEAREVLRFYKMGRVAREDAFADSFDVDIDLRVRNWYVHLWSAEESYVADLGLKTKDGTLIPLVRSQLLHMPRPHPAITIDQRFMKLESKERRAEMVPPPPVEHERSQEVAASPVNEVIDGGPAAEPADSEEIVTEKLEPVYVPYEPQRDRVEPDSEPVVTPLVASTVRWHIDLTAMAERSVVAGLSSASLQKGRPGDALDSTK